MHCLSKHSGCKCRFKSPSRCPLPILFRSQCDENANQKRRVKCIPRPCLLRRSTDLVLVGVEVAAETAGTGDDTIPTDGTLSKRSAHGAAVVTDAEGVGA